MILILMVYKKDYGEDESKDLVYDLRQSLAKLLTLSLENIKKYREERDYKNWFEELDGLYIDISMKLEQEDKEEYNQLVKKLNALIEENPSAYTNKAAESNKIYIQLKIINMWLLQEMEDYKMFGGKEWEDDGL